MQKQITEQQWYAIDNTEQLDTPALVVYLDRVKANIQHAIDIIADPARLRPHVKTHKTKEVSRLLMDAGVNKFKCATIAEAEMLGMLAAKDVLLAYQPFGPKLSRLITLIRKYPDTRFSCLIDNLETAKSISALADSEQLELPVYIDLNVGMNRTGIQPDHRAIQLFEDAVKLNGIKLLGLHAYDGHIQQATVQEKETLGDEIFLMVESLKQELEKRGYQQLNIIIGGSPGFPVYAKKPGVECSPGTFVFWDKSYLDDLSEQDFLPAALLLSRVVSLPGSTKLCLDLGHKSIAAERVLSQRGYFLNAPDFKVESQSEEHLVLEAGENHPWKIGDLFYVLPYHICPTCALYEAATLIENRKATANWKIIARDRKIFT